MTTPPTDTTIHTEAEIADPALSTAPVQVACGHCDSVNAIPREALKDCGQGVARCGHCQQAIFAGTPVELTATNLRTHLRNDIPVLVDFWASWCGSCNLYTPTFNQAAQQFEPFVRCAKFNAEGHMELVKSLNIEEIPTLALYLSGKEIARSKGSLPLPQLEQWMVAQLRPVLAT